MVEFVKSQALEQVRHHRDHRDELRELNLSKGSGAEKVFL